MTTQSVCVSTSPRPREGGGFTLIELVVVIIIVGIIAAIALPRFINMARDARIAAVNAGVGAVNEAANFSFVKCNLAPACNSSITPSGGVTAPDGLTGAMYYGYPAGRSYTGWSSINEWVQMDGFTTVEDPGGGVWTDFQFNGAPDPSTCKVTYLIRTSGSGPPPAVSATIGGC